MIFHAWPKKKKRKNQRKPKGKRKENTWPIMKNIYIKTLKRLCSFRIERLLVLSTIPLQMIHFINANENFKLFAIIIDLLLFEGLALVFKYQRREILNQIKEGSFEPIFDFEGLEENIETLKKSLSSVAKLAVL